MHSATRFSSLSACLFIAVSCSAGVVARWDLNEGPLGSPATGVGTVLDSVGGHNGTPIRGPVYVNCGTSLGLAFNGLNQAVDIADAPAFQLTGSLTMSARVRVYGNGQGAGEYYIFFRGDDRIGLDPYALALRPDAGGLAYCLKINADEIVRAHVPTFGQFYTVAASLDGQTGLASIWIDGQLAASTVTAERPAGPLTGPNPGLAIGNTQSDTFPQPLWGDVDWVQLSDQPVPEPGLIGIAGVAVGFLAALARRRRPVR